MPPFDEIRHRIRGAGGRLLDLALPTLCAGCGREGEALCRACAPALDGRLHLPPGAPLGLPADLPAPLVQVEWCAPFSGVTRRALHQLKYAGDRRIALPLGRSVGRRWRQAGVGGDVLVPVPASPDRVRDRGYDHASLIAHAAGGELGIPVRDKLLVRARRTAAQFDLDHAERARNVRGAFRLRVPGSLADGNGTREGPWIVLVDDVLTTGSTLAACAATLLAAGAFAVSAVTVARER